jgi:hypothetical protein
MKIPVISNVCLPPQFPGLFLFCCWLGSRIDPDWVVAYSIVGTLRLCWFFMAGTAVQLINIFKVEK